MKNGCNGSKPSIHQVHRSRKYAEVLLAMVGNFYDGRSRRSKFARRGGSARIYGGECDGGMHGVQAWAPRTFA